MIKLNSINQIRSSISSFEERVSPDGESLTEDEMHQRYKSNFDKYLFLKLFGPYGEFYEDDGSEHPYNFYDEDAPDLMKTLESDVNLDILPEYLDLSSFSTKPCACKGDSRFPLWFACENPRFLYCKPPPYGRVHLLTESAGKIRLIAPYNTPFVHSTGLYSRCRAILRELRQDCSEDQTVGHRFAQGLTSSGTKTCVSADLSNFTDDILPDLATFGLRSLGLPHLDSYLFNLPVGLPNGKFVIPNKLLMGLKGCFELSSLCHHYITHLAGIRKYVMVGDDILFAGDLAVYQEALKHSGWSINRSKTVVSNTVAVFCGEMYWYGHRVSPRVPKVSSCFHKGKLRKAGVLFSVVRCSVGHLNDIYNRRSVATVMWPVIQLLRKSWKSLICLEAPAKLRGLGFKNSRQGVGLLQLLKRRDILRMSKMSIGIERSIVSNTRWFKLPIELASSKIQVESTFFPALLKKGAVKLDVPTSRPSVRKYVRSLRLYHVLYWYYQDQRLDLNQFKPSHLDSA